MNLFSKIQDTILERKIKKIEKEIDENENENVRLQKSSQTNDTKLKIEKITKNLEKLRQEQKRLSLKRCKLPD